MFYVVTESWHVADSYATVAAAKSGITQKWSFKYPDQKLQIMEESEFRKNEPMVESRNLISGKKIKIKASLAGGCCDPGTERYWSM